MKAKLILRVWLAALLSVWAQAANAAVDTVTIGPQSGTNAPGGTVTYLITVTGSGGANVTFAITNLLPEGVTASFDPNPVDPPGGGPWTTNCILTITTTAAVLPGNYPFSVKATPRSGGSAPTGSSTLVVSIPTTTSLSSSLNSIAYGGAVTFTATVTAAGGGIPTGTVTFLDGGWSLGTAALDGSGQAAFSAAMLSAAGSPHSISAQYSGDTTFQASTSSVLTQVVNLAVLTVSGITAQDKVYDGTVGAVLNVVGAALTGVLSGDTVTLNAAGAVGVFPDKNVGLGKEVTVSGLTLTGPQAGNYVLDSNTLSTTASITPRPLVVTATGLDKVYDGTVTALATLSDNRVAGDSFSVSYAGASFADRNVGSAKAVTLTGIAATGTDSANYMFNDTATALAAITARTLTVTAVSDSRVYDGTTASAGVPALSGAGLASGDTADFTQGFDTKNVGTGKVLTPAGVVNDGNSGNNYMVTFATGAGSITAAPLTVTADNKTKVYGAANPSLTASCSGFVNGENASVLTGSPELSTTADGSSPAGDYPITISVGTLAAANYAFSFVNGSLTVIKGLVVVRADDQERAYGATNPVLSVSYSGFINGDTASVITGVPEVTTAADTNSTVAGSPYTITVQSGTLSAANYTFSFASGQLTVTQAVLTVTADNLTKAYGAAVPALTYKYSGFVNDEDSTLLSGAPELNTTATATSAVGLYDIVVAQGNLLAGNYSFELVNGQLNVTAAVVTGQVGVSDKVYDAGVEATITGRSLTGAQGGDDVQLSGGSAVFGDKNVGNGKEVTVSELSLSGAQAGNYALASSTVTASANISARPLVVSATAVNKEYDGTVTATVTLSDNRLAGDELSVSYAGASFADRNVGTAKPVTVTGIAVTGTDAANYTFNGTAAAQAAITARAVTVTAVSDSKAYDGTTTSVGVPALSGAGLASSDTSAFTQSFDTKNVSTGKMLTPAGLVNDGNSGNNYLVTFVTVDSGSITPASLTVSADDKMKITSMPNPTLTATYAGFVAGENSSVLTTQVTLATTADTSSPPGQYPIIASGAAAPNYEISYVEGVLTVVTPPVLTEAKAEGNSFSFSFESVLGQNYQVEATDSFAGGTWVPVGDVLTGTGEKMTVTNVVTGAHQFFRVNVKAGAK